MSAWASPRRAALAIGAAAAVLACAPDRSPAPLVGTWYSEDERFAGRTLEIEPEWIRFKQGPLELGAVQVSAVEQAGSGEGPIHFEIQGVDREGQDTTLSLELLVRPTEQLRLETQAQPWRRTPHGPARAGQPVPWGRKPAAADPGGST